MSFMDLNAFFMEVHHYSRPRGLDRVDVVVDRLEHPLGWDLGDYALFVKAMLTYGQLVDYS